MSDTAAALGETATDRVVISVSGPDAVSFLQGIVSNDIRPLADRPGLVWTALLTPQGKYLADFFVAALPGAAAGALLLDIKADLSEPTLRRLALYRLRAAVALSVTELQVTRGLGPAPAGALPDPRHPALGWRAYGGAGTPPQIDWDAIRVAHCIPETGVELIPDESYILEQGFERLHGVDFRKGCYVGQEVTARMKHKTELRKGLARVRVEGSAPPGAEITAEGKPVGRLFTQSGGFALAYLRLDRATGPLCAGPATVSPA